MKTIHFVRFSDSLLILYSPPHTYGTTKSTPYLLFTPSHVRHYQVHSLSSIHPLTRTALPSPLLILYSPPHTYGTTKSTPYLLFTPSHVRHYQVIVAHWEIDFIREKHVDFASKNMVDTFFYRYE